jgi:hypothetical protein
VVENLVRFHFQHSLTLNHVAKINIKGVFIQGDENFLHLSLSLLVQLQTIKINFFFSLCFIEILAIIIISTVLSRMGVRSKRVYYNKEVEISIGNLYKFVLHSSV